MGISYCTEHANNINTKKKNFVKSVNLVQNLKKYNCLICFDL